MTELTTPQTKEKGSQLRFEPRSASSFASSECFRPLSRRLISLIIKKNWLIIKFSSIFSFWRERGFQTVAQKVFILEKVFGHCLWPSRRLSQMKIFWQQPPLKSFRRCVYHQVLFSCIFKSSNLERPKFWYSHVLYCNVFFLIYSEYLYWIA